MENQDPGWISTLLDGLGQQSVPTEFIADRIIELFGEAEKKLSPIIGSRGLTKLYYANINQISVQYPWLATTTENCEPSVNRLQFLRSVLSRRSDETCKQCGLALLQGFYMRLVSLIGQAVTDILLRSVWEQSSAKHARGL